MAAGRKPVGLVVALSLITGIAFAFAGEGISRFTLFAISGAGLLMAMLLYFVLLRYATTPLRAYKVADFHWIWTAVAYFSLGVGTVAYNRPEQLPQCDGAIATARVLEVRQTNRGDRLLVDIQRLDFPDRRFKKYTCLKGVLLSDAVTVIPGDIIAFRSTLRPPADNPNFISSGYAETMRRKGVAAFQKIESREIKHIGHKSSLLSKANGWRESMTILIEKSGLSRPTSNFLISVLLADRDFLASETMEKYSDAGVAHILAVSGMHVGIVSMVVFALLFFLNLTGYYKLRYIISLLAIWGFVIFTGMGYSAVRSALMITFAFSGRIFERRNSSINALLWAAVFILVFSPLSLFDIGFQMSFLCVWALIEFPEKFNPIDHRRHPWLYKGVGLLLASMTATGASWMLAAHYFERIPLMFLPVNILALPLLPLYLVFALAHLMINAIFGISFSWLTWLLNNGYDCFIRSIEMISSNGKYTLNLGVGFGSVVIWTAGLVMLAIAIKAGKRKVHLYSVSALCFMGSLVSIPALADEKEESGLIVCNSYQEVKLHSYIDKKLTEVEMPRRNMSIVKRNGYKILCVDIPLEDIEGAAGKVPFKPDVVIVCSGYKGTLAALDSIIASKAGLSEEKAGAISAPVFILHNSMRKKHESRLQAEADSISLSVHSLRYAGPFRRMEKVRTKLRRGAVGK